ncbi:MAG TPA: hypothetical protein VFA79_01160 [Myxococcales bacterium]|nr:hypothetical protein [Myxococcales bacterium]
MLATARKETDVERPVRALHTDGVTALPGAFSRARIEGLAMGAS